MLWKEFPLKCIIHRQAKYSEAKSDWFFRKGIVYLKKNLQPNHTEVVAMYSTICICPIAVRLLQLYFAIPLRQIFFL